MRHCEQWQPVLNILGGGGGRLTPNPPGSPPAGDGQECSEHAHTKKTDVNAAIEPPATRGRWMGMAAIRGNEEPVIDSLLGEQEVCPEIRLARVS